MCVPVRVQDAHPHRHPHEPWPTCELRMRSTLHGSTSNFNQSSLILQHYLELQLTSLFFQTQTPVSVELAAGCVMRPPRAVPIRNRSVPTAVVPDTRYSPNDKRITPRRDPCACCPSGPISAAHTLSVLACSSPPGEEESVPHAPRPSTPLSVTRLSAPRREPVSLSLRCCAPSGRSLPRAVPVRCLRRIPVHQRAARAPGLRV